MWNTRVCRVKHAWFKQCFFLNLCSDEFAAAIHAPHMKTCSIARSQPMPSICFFPSAACFVVPSLAQPQSPHFHASLTGKLPSTSYSSHTGLNTKTPQLLAKDYRKIASTRTQNIYNHFYPHATIHLWTIKSPAVATRGSAKIFIHRAYTFL